MAGTRIRVREQDQIQKQLVALPAQAPSQATINRMDAQVSSVFPGSKGAIYPAGQRRSVLSGTYLHADTITTSTVSVQELTSFTANPTTLHKCCHITPGQLAGKGFWLSGRLHLDTMMQGCKDSEQPRSALPAVWRALLYILLHMYLMHLAYRCGWYRLTHIILSKPDTVTQ